MTVSFEDRSDFNNLYLDYINDFEKVNRFFSYNFKNQDDFIECVKDKSKTYLKNADFDRIRLADVLKDQNEKFHSSSASLENIEHLRNDNSFAPISATKVCNGLI